MLAKGKAARKQAEREWHRLMGEGPSPPPSSGLDLRGMINLFLAHADGRVAPATLNFYLRLLKSFEVAHGRIPAASVRPYHVDQWIALHDWSPNTRRGAVTVAKILTRWARRRGYLEVDTLAELEKPGRTLREEIPSAQMASLILQSISTAPFRDFLLAIWGTGCRPGEAAKVRAEDIDEKGTWTIEGKTTRRTGRMRKVYPPPAIVELCRVQAGVRPTGPIFRNDRGRPWTTDAYGARMRRVRKALFMGPEVVCYSFRHLFATDAEEEGVAPATVAALLGHSSVAQLRTYSKLHSRDDHLRDAVAIVRGIKPDNPSRA